ncbi:hypothetical protein MHAEM_08816, partial [Mycolicibacterium phlei]|nr:hypothetical protein [Mycolicibacterium phlei]
TTHMTDKHHVEWIPPDGLDNGQPRINTIHQPELLLADLTDEDDEPDSTQTDNPRTEPGGPAPPTNGAA